MNRKTARENAFLLLFERECRRDESAEEIFDRAIEARATECDDYVRRVFFGAEERRSEIDERMEKHLVGWRATRVSATSRALLHLAIYEMLAEADIPAKVSINEAVELSKKFDDEKAYVFVNGVLNAVAKELAAVATEPTV